VSVKISKMTRTDALPADLGTARPGSVLRELPLDLAGCIAKAQPLLTRRAKIQTALEAATGSVPELLNKRQELQSALVRVSTRRALGEATPADVARAQADLDAADTEYQTAATMRSGFAAELLDQQPALAAARQDLLQHRPAYVADVIEQFTAEYREAAAQFGRLILRARLIETTLGTKIGLPAPESCVTEPPDISEIPAAAITVGKVSAELAAAITDCESLRRGHERRMAARPAFSPTACYRFIRGSQAGGHFYPAGALTSAEQIPLDLLEKLYRTKAVTMEHGGPGGTMEPQRSKTA